MPPSMEWIAPVIIAPCGPAIAASRTTADSWVIARPASSCSRADGIVFTLLSQGRQLRICGYRPAFIFLNFTFLPSASRVAM